MHTKNTPVTRTRSPAGARANRGGARRLAVAVVALAALVVGTPARAQSPYDPALAQPGVYVPPHARTVGYPGAPATVSPIYQPAGLGGGTLSPVGATLHYHGTQACQQVHNGVQYHRRSPYRTVPTVYGTPARTFPTAHGAAAVYNRQQAQIASQQRNRRSRNSKLALFAIGAAVAIALSSR